MYKIENECGNYYTTFIYWIKSFIGFIDNGHWWEEQNKNILRDIQFMLNMYVFHIQLMLVGVNTAVEISSLCIQTLDFQSIYLCVNHLPWCSAWDRFSGCFKSDECSDDGKYTPHINKTMPPKLETEANRNQPHPQQCSSLQIRKDVLVTEVNQYILHQNHIS